MRTLAFDGRTGASGDMLLGALLAAGADRAALDPVEAALPVAYDVETVDRNGVAATSVTVRLTDEAGDVDGGHAHEHDGADGHDHDGVDGHAHEHGDGHSHGHDDGAHDHTHDHPPAEGHGPHRSHDEVRERIAGLAIPDDVREDALATYELLAAAEAAVHDEDPATVGFHEVGADDAVADVVGAALLLDDLDVERVVTTPPAAGGGEATFSHGTYPVPTPAVLELAERADWSLRGGPVETELLTPTGAAILAHHADGVDRLPELDVEASGAGAGSKELPDRPNVLRALVGEATGRLRREEIAVLETHLDDATPETLGDLQRSLSAVGARDVSVTPLTMKKSRPGHLVRVIARPEDARRVARRLAAETGTLGVREAAADHRYVADRRVETVTVALDGADHAVDVKVATDDAGSVLDVTAEHDDAAAVAAETDRPSREVARLAEAAFRNRSDGA
jgi:uncharacterized protein (TIGR00299 family) protein